MHPMHDLPDAGGTTTTTATAGLAGPATPRWLEQLWTWGPTLLPGLIGLLFLASYRPFGDGLDLAVLCAVTVLAIGFRFRNPAGAWAVSLAVVPLTMLATSADVSLFLVVALAPTLPLAALATAWPVDRSLLAAAATAEQIAFFYAQGRKLIDRGAELVSDDYTILSREGAQLIARAPDGIRGEIEVRGIGIVSMPQRESAPVALIVRIEVAPDRLPDAPGTRRIAGIDIEEIALPALEPSATIKVELALRRVGMAA